MEDKLENIAVQSGEFIIVEGGEAHITGWVEDWPDAPTESSGYRCVEPVGCYLSEEDIRKAGADGDFVEFESKAKQYIPDESYEQGDLDLELSKGFKTISFADFIKHHPDGWYFVLSAPRMSYGLSAQILDEWKAWKAETGNPEPEAGQALEWISGPFAAAHPELDFASMRDEVFTMISCEEEDGTIGFQEHPLIGARIRILKMKGEPNYDGREGTVTHVDGGGQIHGTWGGCAVIEGDLYEIIGQEDAAPSAPSEPSPAPESPKYLTAGQILDIIADLAKSQGHWGRLFDEIMCSRRHNPKTYREWAQGMEAKNFADTREVEEGKLPKACPKTRYWSVPVVYEMYGTISVEADSAEEAYDKVKNHPEDFNLPDEGFYVDDSFKVADDDKGNAVELIKELSPVDPE